MSTELVTTQKLLVKLPKNVDKPQEQLDLQYEQSLAALVALKDEQTLPAEIRQHADRLTKWLNRESDAMENMDTSTRLTQIAMVQPTTQHAAKPDNAKPGDLFSTVGDLISRPFKFRVLYGFRTHVRFQQGEKAPVCGSPDGVLGSPLGKCDLCAFAPMGTQKIPGTTTVKPWNDQKTSECANQLTFLVVDSTYSNIYEITFSKTSFKAGNVLATLAKGSGDKLWNKEFMLETEKQANAKGTYYILKVSPAGNPIDDGHDKVCLALKSFYVAGRQKFLRVFYDSYNNADQTAQQAESGFNPNGALAGLDGGVEENLNAPVQSPATSAKTRTSAKPM